MKHNNNTGRWVVPFRPAWSVDSSSFVVGSMQRAVDVFDASTGKLAASLKSEFLTAIPSRFALTAVNDRPLLACGTSSGRVHIFR